MMFQALKYMEKSTPPLTHAPRPQLMSAMSLRLIDTRADRFRRAYHNHNVARTLTKAVIKSLEVDTRRIAEVVAEEIGACL